MLDIFHHLLARIRGPDRGALTSQGIALSERVLSEKKYSPEVAAAIESKSLFERWEFISALLSLKPDPAFHFLHVPKTGGTTFGETLGRDRKVIILSVDASADTLARQVVRFASSDNQTLVMTRAHHSLALVYNSGCHQRFRLMLTAYRPPASIHISNVNMIMRRIRRYTSRKSQPASEREFSEEWLSTLPSPFEYNAVYAQQLLTSDHYRQKMGGIYQRFFNSRDWQSLIRKNQLLVVDSRDLDVLLTKGFGYEKPPERRNVSLQPLLTTSDVSERDIEPLIAPDRDVATFLKQNLSCPDRVMQSLFGRGQEMSHE